MENGIKEKYGLQKRLEAVKHCRDIGKKDMKFNCATPEITVDPETYVVKADGVVMTCEIAKSLPLTQIYKLVLILAFSFSKQVFGKSIVIDMGVLSYIFW